MKHESSSTTNIRLGLFFQIPPRQASGSHFVSSLCEVAWQHVRSAQYHAIQSNRLAVTRCGALVVVGLAISKNEFRSEASIDKRSTCGQDSLCPIFQFNHMALIISKAKISPPFRLQATDICKAACPFKFWGTAQPCHMILGIVQWSTALVYVPYDFRAACLNFRL